MHGYDIFFLDSCFFPYTEKLLKVSDHSVEEIQDESTTLRSFQTGHINGRCNLIPMQFNPDKNKQAVQVIFSQKKEAIAHPPVFFNGSEVVVKTEHKHLGIILDSKLSFQSHVREAIIKARKGIGIIRFLSKYVSRDVLDLIYKLYVRPHLDCGDIIYHRHDPA